jgi:D-aminoacyl-tRNA deacylase
MKIAIITSKIDLAGTNIKEKLINNHNFIKTDELFDDENIYENKSLINDSIKLYTIQKTSTVFRENLDNEIKADLFIYATKHQSASKIPSLSVHCTGNWDNANFGGKNRTLCKSPQNFLKSAMIYMEKNIKKLEYEKLSEYDIVQEVTHHGPFMNKPLIYIEIGADEKRWKDSLAGKFIAEIICNLIRDFDTIKLKKYKVGFGIGGLHTTPNFKKIIINEDDNSVAISHVCPKYMLDKLDEDTIIQGINMSDKKANYIIFDWKGMGSEKTRIVNLCEKLISENKIDVELKKTKDF